ncbi:RNA-binding S4 domain-containing protein [Undibacter mobilis]|uniref:RNA-binding S4 domain-containing protein n=1 Tax=Undibacter mobilis TaxID=2292256 RepID=A0A371B874_9BRAD|nr:S4 domain-containing protein [Undibacter mobilis]RDV03789.1 RNA-binding S4 domain-containing protein [Undibacter mobilis]
MSDLRQTSQGPGGGAEKQRIDKWLWHARMVRTRSDAARLVDAGHARVNGQRVTAPAHLLRAGDVITLALDRSVRVVEVLRFSDRRGAARDAAATYRMLENSGGYRSQGAA